MLLLLANPRLALSKPEFKMKSKLLALAAIGYVRNLRQVVGLAYDLLNRCDAEKLFCLAAIRGQTQVAESRERGTVRHECEVWIDCTKSEFRDGVRIQQAFVDHHKVTGIHVHFIDEPSPAFPVSEQTPHRKPEILVVPDQFDLPLKQVLVVRLVVTSDAEADLHANELTTHLPAILQPIGIDEPQIVVIGVMQDRLYEVGFVWHGCALDAGTEENTTTLAHCGLGCHLEYFHLPKLTP